MDTIAGIRAYLAVVETGSFTAAADREGLSTALVSKYVAQLEARFGARLLERTTRRVRSSEAGRGFAERAKRLIEDFDELRASVRADHETPRGVLKATAPTTFGEMRLAPLVERYLEAYPDMTVDLYLTDRRVGLMEEGFDVAIRIGALERTSLIARRLGSAPLVVCATPDYLRARGAPERPSDLARHSCVIDTNLRAPNHWSFIVDGAPQSVRVDGRFRVNSASAARDRALAGLGVVRAPRWAVADALADGRLVALLSAFDEEPLGIHALFLERRGLSAKVRSFVDHVAEGLRALDP